MHHDLRVVIAQLNALVGDVQGNTRQVIESMQKARDQLHADVIVFPELFLTGYPPEDLLFRVAFLRQIDDALQEIAKATKGIHCVLGHTLGEPEHLYNAASVLYKGQILATYKKRCLPNFDVFDERRYFIEGTKPLVLPIKHVPVGIMICEDLWHGEPLQETITQGARCILSLNASPFTLKKADIRQKMLLEQSKRHKVPILYSNLIGGQDGLVFDGGSMAVDETGQVCVQAPFFETALTAVDLSFSQSIEIQKNNLPKPLSLEEKSYRALMLGVRDYVHKNGFSGVLLGLSGGIDSALTLAIAVDALGSDNVEAVLMPSQFTSKLSDELATEQAVTMNVNYHTIPIEPPFQGFLDVLKPLFKNTEHDVTEQNIQARCRGSILMALSNKFGKMVLTTGNRSELAVGYSTLYGDMAGGLCVLMDVPKTWVYKLAHYRNSLSPVIPKAVIDRHPSAELAHDQKDEDSLPPYETLDTILELYINQELGFDAIVAQGFLHTDVQHVIMLVARNEYKRRQAPPGIRLQRRAFGRDRRYPMTQRFREYAKINQ